MDMTVIMKVFIDILSSKNQYKNFIKNLNYIKTEQDYIIFTLNLMSEYNFIPRPIPTPKNAEQSDKLRLEANKIFLKNSTDNLKCIEAMQLYSYSISLAPYPSKQLAFGYANRSAVSYQLGLLSECIQDIDRLHDLDYPDILWARLCVRKIYCLIILGHKSIQDKINETQKYLENLSLDDKSKEKLLLQLKSFSDKTSIKKIKKGANLPTKSTKPKSQNPAPCIKSYNKEIPYASDAVALKYNERYGKHIVATRDIPPGEVIVIEKPYSYFLMRDHRQSHCSNCLKPCWILIPCKFCIFTMYCSEKCRDIEWKKCHDVECSIFIGMMGYVFSDLDLFSVKLTVLAVKEAGNIKKLRNMFKKLDKSNDPRTKGFSQDGKLHNEKYISICNLATHFKERSNLDIFMKSLNACFALYLLATRTQIFCEQLPEDISVLIKNDDAIFLANLILRYQQILSCNAYYFMEAQGLMMKELAIIILPFCSYINHSCNNNVLRQSRSKHILLYASEPIRKDEQIFESYGQTYGFSSKTDRQQKLFDNYYFRCNCIACEKNWPIYYELPQYNMLVANKTILNRIEKRLQNLYKYVDEVTINTSALRNRPEVITDLLMMIQTLHDYVPMPCSEIIDLVDTLEKVYELHGNVLEIPEIWWLRPSKPV